MNQNHNNINEIVKQVMEKVLELQNRASSAIPAVPAINGIQPAGATAAQEAYSIPLGISNRHVHLSQQDLESLFGPGYQLTSTKPLGQPGQFACKETVTVCGPKGAIEKVRVLGPVRKQSQVEILAGDSFKLGIKAAPAMSGELMGTPGATLVGPCGSVQLQEGVIVAQRHIHMTLGDARKFGVYDGQVVSIVCNGTRPGVLHNVTIRANQNSALECHLDTEEANALGMNGKSYIKIAEKQK